MSTVDPSNGYETVSAEFMSVRNASPSVPVVRAWAQSLPRGASVLDLGCGDGVPISEALVREGATVFGVDASPSLAAAFRSRFPESQVECCAVEDSRFFGRRFDGIVAWGLLFLLAPEVQGALLQKAAVALRPGGRFIFTAPHQECEWVDNLTGRTSVSLGAIAYRRILEAEGLALIGEAEDEGQNHYYSFCKPGGPNGAA